MSFDLRSELGCSLRVSNEEEVVRTSVVAPTSGQLIILISPFFAFHLLPPVREHPAFVVVNSSTVDARMFVGAKGSLGAAISLRGN